MSVKKYRQKSAGVEAIQFTGDNFDAIVAFVGENCRWGNRIIIPNAVRGSLNAETGDYIVRGPSGLFYPCSPETFATTFEPVDEPAIEPSGMNFGQAIHALKLGEKVAREGWNGKGMFLFLLPAGTIPKAAIHDPKLREVLDGNGKDSFEALASIRMKTTDDEILTGWLASQTDMLAEDWVIVE